MLEVIERILNIEAAAEEVVCETRAAKESFDADVSKEISELENGIKQRSAERCAKLKAFEDNDAQVQIERIKEQTVSAGERLDRMYAENSEKWVSRIFDRITNA